MIGFYSRRNKLSSALGYSIGIYSQKLGGGINEISGFSLNQPNRILFEKKPSSKDTSWGMVENKEAN